MTRPQKDAVIRASGLGKVYTEGKTEFRALRGVHLQIRGGELTLLMGPSGSGKTTLLSILGCILRASEGTLELLGEKVSALPENELPRIRRDAIGFVFQGFNLFPTLTAAENIALALDVRGVRRATARQRAEELLAEVDLTPKASKIVSRGLEWRPETARRDCPGARGEPAYSARG